MLKLKLSYIFLIAGVCSVLGATFSADVSTAIDAQSLPELRMTLNGTTLQYINQHSKDAKYGGNALSLVNAGETMLFENVEIKGRGNSTWRMAKKPYQIKLNSKESLLDLGKSKKYILLANQGDASHMRNELAYYLASLLGEQYAPKGEFIDFYVDDAYQGLYYLSTKNEIGNKRINITDENGVVMELDNMYAPDDEYFVSDDGDRFVLKDAKNEENPSIGVNDFKVSINKLNSALNNADWAGVESQIDVESFAQYYLVSELTNNPDAYFTSLYFYKDGSGDKVHAGPIWDYDIACGNGESYTIDWSLYEYPEFTWARAKVIKTSRHTSGIFMKLSEFPEFQAIVNELFKTKITGQKQTIIKHIDDRAAYIRDSAIANNRQWGRKDFDASINTLKDWVSRAYDYMQVLYGQSTNIEDGCYRIDGLSDKLYIRRNTDGSYRIAQVDSSKVLDVSAGSAEINTPVQWYTWNGTAAQRWFISEGANGKYYIFSKINGLTLDIKNYRVVRYSPSATTQALSLEPIEVPFASFDEEQEYVINSAIRDGLSLDIAGGSKASGANLQVYTSNNTVAQKFKFKKNSDGTYEIINVGSGKAIDVYTGSLNNGENVWQYDRNGTDAQKWLAVMNSDGTVTFMNSGSLKVLDVARGRGESGTNVWQYVVDGTKEQKWRVVATDTAKMAKAQRGVLDDGDYVIHSSINPNYVIDVQGGSLTSATNIWLYKTNGTDAQKWRITHDEDGFVVLTSIRSGKTIDVTGANIGSGTNIWQYEPNNTKAQKWIATANRDGSITLISSLAADRAIDVSGASMRNCSNIQLYAVNGTGAQKWIFEKIDN